MRKSKGAVLGTVALVLVTFSFLTCCRLHSMDKAESFEVNAPNLEPKVLIATQGSKFKNAVVAGVIEHLKQRPAYVKVIDVTQLAQVDAAAWTAVVILHTWQSWKPQADAKAFIERTGDRHKLIVLSTSGSGEARIDGVDAIATASVMSDAPARAAEISKRVDVLLAERSPKQ
jgi:hypothetical protein